MINENYNYNYYYGINILLTNNRIIKVIKIKITSSDTLLLLEGVVLVCILVERVTPVCVGGVTLDCVIGVAADCVIGVAPVGVAGKPRLVFRFLISISSSTCASDY